MTDEDLDARAKDAENVAFEDVLQMGIDELRRMMLSANCSITLALKK